MDDWTCDVKLLLSGTTVGWLDVSWHSTHQRLLLHYCHKGCWRSAIPRMTWRFTVLCMSFTSQY